MLNKLRALDLTDQKGFYCGKILAQFGIEVIKIEPPGGDPARKIGPFYHNTQDPEKSLFWFAYNDSKKGISLNIHNVDGQEIFKKLVMDVDIIIESFDPGYLDKLGLSYEILNAINPKLIMTSITPFGLTGPYKNYKGSDLIFMAMGGIMSQTGERERSPCRLDPYHSYCLAGSNAALATLIAHTYRQMSGEGQHIDVSIFECVVRENYREVPVSWEFGHYNVERSGGRMNRGGFYTRTIWPCKDGHVTWTMFGGAVGSDDNEHLARWMQEEGLLSGLEDINWRSLDFDRLTQSEVDRIEKNILLLTLRHTKKELEEEAIKRGIRLSAVNDVKELFESEQLRYRGFWRYIEHSELSDKLAYPGQLFKANDLRAGIRTRAPHIGEHNKLIYQDELGLTNKTISDLKNKGII